MRDILNESMFGEEHILLQRLKFMNYLWIYCIKKPDADSIICQERDVFEIEHDE